MTLKARLLSLALLASTPALVFANTPAHVGVIPSGGTLTEGDAEGFDAHCMDSPNGHYRLALWHTGELCLYRVDPLTGYQTLRWTSFKEHGRDYAAKWAALGASFSLRVLPEGEVCEFTHVPGRAPAVIWRFDAGMQPHAGDEVVLGDDGALMLAGPGHAPRLLAWEN